MKIFSLMLKFAPTRFLLMNLALNRAKAKVRILTPFFQKKMRILEIGSGNGALIRLLQYNGYNVEALDIENISFWPEEKINFYNGVNMPYKNKSFDTALLITVLHHVLEPEVILKEAKRVASNIIIIEEIYSNKVIKYMTFAIDSLFNLEFLGHPHTNKTDKEWRQTFHNLGFKIEKCEYFTSLGILQRALYIVSTGY